MIAIVNDFLNWSNFQQAWLKVKENKGCAGADEETIDDFACNLQFNLAQLREAVASSTYRPHPYKQVLIPKSNGKLRELRIPTVRDRIVQQALLNVLAPIVEPSFSPCSFAYRPNLSYIHAVEKIAYWRDREYTWVLDADIVKYFDSIDHQILLVELRQYINNPGILCLLKAWISSGILTNKGLESQDKGIPQGAGVSPLLANIYLNKFDHAISQTDLQLVRYADDFLVLAQTREKIIEAYSEVIRLLHSLNLNIHTDKTIITSFHQGFRFLGHGFLDDAIFPVDKPKQKTQKQRNRKKKDDLESLQFKEEDVLQSSSLSVKNVTKSKQAAEEKTSVTKNIQKNFWSQPMATLYLLEQGTSLFKENLRFIIYVPEKEKFEIPIREVERILLFGNINLSTPAIAACLESQINVLFLSPSGRYKGHLWSKEFSHINTELLQYQFHNQPKFKLVVSQAIVRGKLINSKQLLLRLNRQRKNVAVQKAISGISSDLEAIESVADLDTLRGYEGISAARYFPALGQLITNSKLEFSQRHRQPPTDPINALLSFGYTLLFNNVLSLIIAEGLSPYFGNFHYGEKKKPYLAFDLMEEFRSPIVDTLVLSLINKSILKSEDFEWRSHDNSVYLNDKSRKTFLNQFESRINEKVTHLELQSQITYREVIQLQIRLYKRSLLSSTTYEPFLRLA